MNKKNWALVISAISILGVLLHFIGVEQKKFVASLSLIEDRPVIINENTNFETIDEKVDLETEIFEVERLEKIDEFLNVIYKLNKDEKCNLTKFIFNNKSGKIQNEELFTVNNLKLIEAEWFPKINEYYNYDDNNLNKNDYEKRIEKYLTENNNDAKKLTYQVFIATQESLNFFKNYFGISPTLNDLQRTSKNILSVDEQKDSDGNNFVTAVVLPVEDKNDNCHLSEIKEVIKVTEDSEYIYVYISYLKYDSTKISVEIAHKEALEEGPNYKLFLKKDLNKYYLDRYEYLNR